MIVVSKIVRRFLLCTVGVFSVNVAGLLIVRAHRKIEVSLCIGKRRLRRHYNDLLTKIWTFVLNIEPFTPLNRNACDSSPQITVWQHRQNDQYNQENRQAVTCSQELPNCQQCESQRHCKQAQHHQQISESAEFSHIIPWKQFMANRINKICYSVDLTAMNYAVLQVERHVLFD